MSLKYLFKLKQLIFVTILLEATAQPLFNTNYHELKADLQYLSHNPNQYQYQNKPNKSQQNNHLPDYISTLVDHQKQLQDTSKSNEIKRTRKIASLPLILFHSPQKLKYLNNEKSYKRGRKFTVSNKNHKYKIKINKNPNKNNEIYNQLSSIIPSQLKSTASLSSKPFKRLKRSRKIKKSHQQKREVILADIPFLSLQIDGNNNSYNDNKDHETPSFDWTYYNPIDNSNSEESSKTETENQFKLMYNPNLSRENENIVNENQNLNANTKVNVKSYPFVDENFEDTNKLFPYYNLKGTENNDEINENWNDKNYNELDGIFNEKRKFPPKELMQMLRYRKNGRTPWALVDRTNEIGSRNRLEFFDRINGKTQDSTGFKGKKLKVHQTEFMPSISPGVMMNLGEFFKNLAKNIDYMETHNFTDDEKDLLEGDHITKVTKNMKTELENRDPKSKATHTAAFLHAIRTYRPSHKIRALVAMRPEGYHGTYFTDPNYMWMGLG